jgi:hypothetical protein
MDKDTLREERRYERQELLRQTVEGLRGSLVARGVRDGSWTPSIGNLGISRSLEELISPYLHPGMDIVEARVLALVGGVAWNLVAAPEIGREEQEELRRALTTGTAARLDRLLRHMCRRMRDLFPGDRRIVSQTHVTQQSDGSFFFRAAAVA